MGMTEGKLIKGSDAKRVPFWRYLALCVLNVTGVLYNGDCWLGKSRTVDMKPAENPKCESIILRPIIKCAILTRHCNIFDALKFEIVRNTRLLKRKCGHSRNHTAIPAAVSRGISSFHPPYCLGGVLLSFRIRTSPLETWKAVPKNANGGGVTIQTRSLTS